jgi:hypothetical protein
MSEMARRLSIALAERIGVQNVFRRLLYHRRMQR